MGTDGSDTSSRQTQLIQWGGMIIATLVLISGVLLPTAPGLEPDMQLVLSIFVFTIVLWIAKPVPFTVSSILAMGLLFALGTTDSFDQAVSGFASELVFFLFLLILLGNTISKTGLDERAARRMLSTQSTPFQSIRSLSTNLFALSFFMPSAVARAVTFIPLVHRISDVYDLGRKSNFEKSSFFILGHVNPIASMALMTGGGMAIITSEIIRSSVRPITWVEWAIYMIPPVMLLYAFSAFSAARLYPVNNSKTISDSKATSDLSQSVTDNENESQPWTKDEQIVAWVMGGTVLAWVVGSFIGIPAIIPAIFAVVILSLPRIQVITAEDVQSMSWGILFVIGAMFSILEVMETTGTLDFIVQSATDLIPFGMMTLWQSVAVLFAIAIVMRSLFSTASAAITVVLPIVIEFGSVLGINQFYLSLSILTIIGSTTFLPFNTTSVLLSFDRGPLSIRDVFIFGCVTMIYAFVVVPLAWLFYWPFIDSVL